MNAHDRLITHRQLSPYSSPWSLTERIGILLWETVWTVLCSWTPKPLNRWRVLWLRLFGASITGHPFVHQRARIQVPWRITLHHRACLGDAAYAYSLGDIEIMEDATVAQQAYLCTGTHQFDDPNRPLQTGKITVGKSAFVGARAFVLPGVTIGRGAVVGACSLVSRDVPDYAVVCGNPAVVLREAAPPAAKTGARDVQS